VAEKTRFKLECVTMHSQPDDSIDQIIIKDLRVIGIIGVNPQERLVPQEILINVVIFADLRKAGLSDNIDDCINYKILSEEIHSLAETAQRFTVEALAEDICTLCLKKPGVVKVRARVEKPGAVQFVDSVGVEIVRQVTP
jgi:FolB domain-containing protein